MRFPNKDQKLQADVKATNLSRAEALRLYDQMAPVLRSFVGQKVVKKDNSLTAKVKKALPELPFDCGGANSLRCYFSTQSAYSLMIVIKSSVKIEGVESYCTKNSTTHLYLGSISDGVLQKVEDRPDIRCDYTFEAIKELQGQCAMAKQTYEDLKSALAPFDESN